jgi:hypothetical protein
MSLPVNYDGSETISHSNKKKTKGDRFIPRSHEMNLELCNSLLTRPDINNQQFSSKENYVNSIHEEIFHAPFKSRILKFNHRPINQCPKTESELLSYYKSKPDKKPIEIQLEKVLDMPNYRNDFYTNLIDWSCKNVMAVALYSSVYLTTESGQVNKVVDSIFLWEYPYVLFIEIYTF